MTIMRTPLVYIAALFATATGAGCSTGNGGGGSQGNYRGPDEWRDPILAEIHRQDEYTGERRPGSWGTEFLFVAAPGDMPPHPIIRHEVGHFIFRDSAEADDPWTGIDCTRTKGRYITTRTEDAQ